MKRILCAVLAALLLLCESAAFAAADYSVAEKLLKQLQAGSGFSGSLTVERFGADGSSLLSTPAVISCDAIYVRESETSAASTRVDLTLQAGSSALSEAHFRYQEGALSLQSDLLGADWYSLQGLELPLLKEVFGEQSASILNQDYTGVPSLAAVVMKYAPEFLNGGLESLTSDLLLRVDLWLEAWRQTADIGKAPDGTSTITVNYSVPSNALKNEAKTLLLDVLQNSEYRDALSKALGEEEAALLLNPEWQRYYFQAIESMPLNGELTISRVMSTRGATLSLKVELPLYDAETGDALLTYSRVSGTPDTQTVSLLGENTEITVDFTHTSSAENGTESWEGRFTRTASGEVFGAAFSISSHIEEGTDSSTGEETYLAEYEAVISPLDGCTGTLPAPVTVALSARFASPTARTAATNVNASLSVTGTDGCSTVLTMEGKSRKKWEPSAITGEPVKLAEMDLSGILALVQTCTGNLSSLAAEFSK